MAAAASGNGGAPCAHRPELAHEAIDDAARRPAGEQVGERGVPRGVARERGAMHRAGRRFRAQQVAGADLHAAAPSAIAAATPRASAMPPAAITGTRTALHDLRHERERADLRRQVVGQEHARDDRRPRAPCAMIASTPRASSQRASSTVVADDRIFAPQRSHALRAARRAADRNESSRPRA